MIKLNCETQSLIADIVDATTAANWSDVKKRSQNAGELAVLIVRDLVTNNNKPLALDIEHKLNERLSLNIREFELYDASPDEINDIIGDIENNLETACMEIIDNSDDIRSVIDWFIGWNLDSLIRRYNEDDYSDSDIVDYSQPVGI